MHILLVQFFHSQEQLLHGGGSRTQESGFLGADYLCGFLIHDQYPGRNLMRSFLTAPGSWVILCCNTRLQFTQKSSNRIILGRKIAMIQENFMIELFYKASKSPSFFLPPWYPQTFLIKLLTKQPSHQAPSSSSSFTSYQLAESISPRPSCISTPMRNLQAHCTTNVAHPQNHSSCSKPTCTHSLHIPSKTTFTDTAIYRRALFVGGQETQPLAMNTTIRCALATLSSTWTKDQSVNHEILFPHIERSRTSHIQRIRTFRTLHSGAELQERVWT